MTRAAARRAALAMLASMAWACATTGRPAAEIVWPPPGVDAPAEVVLLEVVSELRRSGAAALLRAIAGAESRTASFSFAQPVGVATAAGRLAVVDPPRSRVTLSELDGRDARVVDLPEGFRPTAAAFSPDGDWLMVCDGPTGEVRRFDRDGRASGVVLEGGRIGRCGGLTTTRNGDLVLVDTQGARVLRVSEDGHVIAATGSRGAEPGQFNFPTAVAEAPDRTVWVLDALNFRVQQLDPELHPIGVFGQLGDGSGHFALPKGLAIDPDGHLYVTDGRFDLVQLFDPRGRLLLVVGRHGGAAGEFWSPAGIACSDDGTLVVADSGNRRVQVLRYRHRGGGS